MCPVTRGIWRVRSPSARSVRSCISLLSINSSQALLPRARPACGDLARSVRVEARGIATRHLEAVLCRKVFPDRLDHRSVDLCGPRRPTQDRGASWSAPVTTDTGKCQTRMFGSLARTGQPEPRLADRPRSDPPTAAAGAVWRKSLRLPVVDSCKASLASANDAGSSDSGPEIAKDALSCDNSVSEPSCTR
jgi:hypothetical protein